MSLRTPTIAARLVIGLVVVNALVYLLAGTALYQSRRQQELEARAATQNLSRSVAITVSGMLDKLDVGLSAAALEVTHELQEGGIKPAQLTAYLARQTQLLRDFEDLWIADASGHIRWGTNLPATPVSIADRTYFQQAMRSTDGRLAISQPIVARVTGAWSVVVARRIDRADGTPFGVALGTLRLLDSFQAIFSPIDLGKHGLVALRSDDMTLLARYSPGGSQGPEPGSNGVSAVTLRALARDPASGSYLATSALDGIARTMSYRRLDRYPLYVFVGREQRELLASWVGEVRMAVGLVLFFTLATGLYCWSSYKRARVQIAAHEAEERAVRLERERLQTILDSAPVGIAFSVAGKLQFGNPQAGEMFGGRLGDEAFSFYADPAERAAIEAELRPGQALAREVRMVGSGGRVRDMLVTFVPTTLNGQAGVLAWLMDITERKRAEEHIRQVSIRNDTALGLTRAGYWEAALDGSGCFHGAPRAAEIFGLLPHAQQRYRLVEDWEDHIRAVDPQAARDAGARLQDMLAGRRDVFSAMYPFRRPIDGRVVWIQSYGRIARDAGGRPVAFYGAAQDVTEHVRVQDELARAKDAATAATRAKSEFLANMSHEIRTPLNAVLGLTHLLRRDDPTPRQAKRLLQVHEAGEHLLALVNGVLDLSKIEARRLQLDDVEFSVADVVRAAVAVVAPQAHAKGLRLAARCDGLPGRVRGDPTRLRQALLNYLGNAVKFTREGFICLRGAAEEEAEAHVRLRFEVEDSGIGIPAERIPSLFQPFEQVDAGASGAGGTGLGLAITKHLSALMGGAAGVTSTPGQGSVFWLTVCLRKVQGPAAGAAPGPDGCATAAAVQARHGGARILLAEDHPVGAEVASDLLRDAGLVVEHAKDGIEALALAGGGGFALVLMDMRMPGMDGLEATRALRRLPGGQAVPIVAFTANAFAEDRQRCLEAGMSDFLSKPVRPQELYGVLMKWLPGPPGGAASPVAAPVQRVPLAAQPAGKRADLECIAHLPGMDADRVREFQARPARYLRMFGTLLEDGPRQLRQARERIAAGDFAQAEAIAHALKGAAALLGAHALMRAAAGLEQGLRARAGGSPELDAALEAIASALHPLRTAPEHGAPFPACPEPTLP